MTARWVGDDPKHHHFSLSGTCPHCSKPSVFVMKTQPHIPPEALEKHYITDPIGAVYGDAYEVWAVLQCQGCKDYICGSILKTVAVPALTAYYRHYPIGSPRVTVADEIPRNIANDYREALQCHWLQCHKATVTMCRRAIQAACIDLGAVGDKLVHQIDDLATRAAITGPLKEQAHEVRLGGNDGAHPGKDGLDNVSPDDAQDMIDFTREFFHHVYVMPRRQEKRKKEREAKKAAAKPLSQPPTP